ncbi:MAG: CoA transferase, partial [bacterium]|nr:CoA transferase [bacterium]
MAPPLQGIKVLDLSRLGPGPYCTMILADLGADVLKIEEPPPTAGRRTGKFDPRVQKETLATSLAHGRNKRSLVLNLKSEAGREIFLKLSRDADVVMDEYRPGVLKRLGVDYETASKLNPRIIYCSITGYGQDGPYRDKVGHDINYISIAGALGMIGDSEGRPVIPLNLLADYAGGSLNAVIGILAALQARQRTGRGQFVDVAMTDGVVSLLAGFIS